MPTGYHPIPYYRNPFMAKPIEQIWEEINGFSDETHSFEALQKNGFVPLDLFILLPPLYVDGSLIKGIIASQCIDVVTEKLPRLKEYFHLCAYSMWCSYPKSETADVYFTTYDNPKRDQWFKRTYPDKAEKILVPLLDSDLTNEYNMVPKKVKKDIDVLTVGRMDPVKNHALIALALKHYREKYQDNIYLTHIVGKKQVDENYNGFGENQMAPVRRIKKILIDPKQYIKLVGYVPNEKMAEYYSRAKVVILASLIEGKNRAITEAISCDTPFICFDKHNQYARGDASAFPEGAGMYCPFHPEALADAIHYVIHNQEKFRPRYSYLKSGGGRKGFFNTIIDSIPYYQDKLPDYEQGNHFNNVWIDLTIQRMYGINLYEYLYKGRARLHGWHNIAAKLAMHIDQCDRLVSAKNKSNHEPEPFYVAQSCFEAAQYDLAYHNYRICSETSTADEQEIFWSLYRMGRCLQLKGACEEKVKAAYLKAYEHSPNRIEPLYRLAMYVAGKKDFKKALSYAKRCISVAKTKGALFLKTDIYDWRRFDHLGWIYMQLEDYAQAKRYIQKALELKAYYHGRKAALDMNLAICEKKLADESVSENVA